MRIQRLKSIARDGAVLVELALVIPIVLLLVAAFLELSRVAMLKHTADAAAYEGARIGIVPGIGPEQATQAAKSLLQAARVKAAEVSVSPTVIQESTPFVTVRVRIPIAQNSWISPFFFMKNAITSSVTLITERPAAIQLSGIDLSNTGLGISAVGIGL